MMKRFTCHSDGTISYEGQSWENVSATRIDPATMPILHKLKLSTKQRVQLARFRTRDEEPSQADWEQAGQLRMVP